jgi:hypothetical protein
MQLTVKRTLFNKTNTIGELYIDGVFFCYTLEDVVRNAGTKKVYGQTAIPYNTYKVILSLSNRFKKVLPEILNVPDFSGVRIHGGNTEADSLGCILVAFNTDKKKIWGSASDALVKKLTRAKKIEITITK